MLETLGYVGAIISGVACFPALVRETRHGIRVLKRWFKQRRMNKDRTDR